MRERSKRGLKDSSCEEEAGAPPTGLNSCAMELLCHDLVKFRRCLSRLEECSLTGMATARDVASKAHTRLTRHKHPNAAWNRQPGPTGGGGNSVGVFGVVMSMLFAEDGLSRVEEGSRQFKEYSLL